ncbi:hypothetical protein HAV15_002121 [Penicillium sp. str. |nr:hypothetical protein HAV15_002121 [Penicillium sp. str. \
MPALWIPSNELLDIHNWEFCTMTETCLECCKHFARNGLVRLNRVFLSASPYNIGVLRANADHEGFRHDVTEIIWDDARLVDAPKLYRDLVLEFDDAEVDPDEGCPNWFVAVCKENLEDLNGRKIPGIDRPDNIAGGKQDIAQPLALCWQLYQKLLQQEKDVLFSNSDVDAFIYGVRRFPGLKRVTITSATHGWLYASLYQTPMIRSFPRGFNYPIPQGWPAWSDEQVQRQIHTWKEATDSHKNQWRAFRNVTSILAQNKHCVSELVLDVNHLPAGLDCEQEHKDLPSFRSGDLKQALAEAKNMKSLRFRTTIATQRDTTAFIPLMTILPVKEWATLRSFELSGFQVKQSDSLNFLAALPKTVRSIELGFLDFLDGNWHGLLNAIRETLYWHQQDKEPRPKLMVGITESMRRAGFGIWLDREVHGFLYGDRPNPFNDVYSFLE